MTFSFQNLDASLARHLGRAVTSRLHPQSNALRAHLSHVLSAPANTPGSLLSDPLFEATFDYERAKSTLGELAPDLLSPALIEALDAPGPRRFARTLRPYRHQLAAWQALLSEVPTSALISSGTGSGKTECFLIPILEDLARIARHKSGPIVGVHALFLYPLNALIASQEGRLSAWTAPFDDRIRFCLYNGLTPEEIKNHDHRQRAWQVQDRKRMRESPAPILVTNATMLEYMLVRTQDRPILEASKKKLRWIVLDEAHTYIGSQAAELALLIRRVMQGFDVDPQDVRIVATSATIGEADGEALRVFLADVGGLPLDRVAFIRGARELPPLSLTPTRAGLPDAAHRATLETSSPEARFDALASFETVHELRDDLAAGPKTLTELATHHHESPEDILATLDLAHASRRDDQSLLPLRGHRFIRTLPGLWACLAPDCHGRSALLTDASWHHGKLFFEPRERCDACDSLVFELVLCRTCGADWLAAEHQSLNGVPSLVPYGYGAPDREDILPDTSRDDQDDDDQAPSTSQHVRLIGACDEPPVRIGRADGRWDDPDGVTRTVAPTVGGQLSCGFCREKASDLDDLVTRGYASRPFLLSVALPQALQHMPKGATEGLPRGTLPFEGRRLLTFTDSRQGSARFAMLLEQEGERRFVQSWLYHQLWAEHVPVDTSELEAEVAELSQAPSSPVINRMLSAKKAELESAKLRVPSMPWTELVERLAATREIESIRKVNFPLNPKFDNPQLLAEFLLQREFLRRPRRKITLETLGLASLRHPKLATQSAPGPWRNLGGSDSEWAAFLGLALEVVRSKNAVAIDDELAKWLGEQFRRAFLVGADEPAGGNIVRFYSRPTTSPPRGRLVNLLAHRFDLNPSVGLGASTLLSILEETWHALKGPGVLTLQSDGRRLDWSRLEVFVPSTIVRCPITLRALIYAPGDLTSYADPTANARLAKGERFDAPNFPFAFPWDRKNGDEHIADWLAKDPTVTRLREVGLWVEFSDRIAEYANYFRAHEHSAQIPAGALRKLESQFTEGYVNILSCSTTMEMGIDIGGLSVVAMNNAPPGPANFLQRSGRAGRRGESTSLSLTMCRPSPHDEAIWHNPTWPFRTPIAIPRVALESRRIVQRHINAFLLGRFLAENPDTNATKLQCGQFYGAALDATDVGAAPPRDRFTRWLASPARLDSLAEPIARLTLGSPLADSSLTEILQTTSDTLSRIAEAWLGEHTFLTAELTMFVSGDEAEKAAISALRINLRRLEEEFLLKDLSTKAWLPVHGFPTDVVPFIPIHLEDLLRQKEAGSRDSAREDDARTSGTFPTRNLPIALSEYAPGAGVVIDGKVHISRGVTLNWKIQPEAVDPTTEIQSFRHATRCRSCGAIEDHLHRIDFCERCGNDNLQRCPYLLPAGFAVALMEEAHNDLTKAGAQPAADPWVACDASRWTMATTFLRYRQSNDGKIFYHNDGLGNGFGICLRCGAASAMVGDKCPGLDDHRPLRGYRSQKNLKTGTCKGNDETHAIPLGRHLGKLAISDVFELQLRFPESLATPSRTALVSLAVALQQALANRLGVERRELGFAITTHDWDGIRFEAIALFDTAPGGAGYAPRAADGELFGLLDLVENAEAILACAEHNCDRACHGCLLSFDTDRFARHLDRHEALELASAVHSALQPQTLAPNDLDTEEAS